MAELKLPSWAEEKKGVIFVNIDEAYPKYLSELGLEKTRLNVGVVKQCVMRDMSDLVRSQQPTDGAISIRLKGDRKLWSDVNLSGKPGDHDKGLRLGGRFRQMLLKKRAAMALAIE